MILHCPFGGIAMSKQDRNLLGQAAIRSEFRFGSKGEVTE